MINDIILKLAEKIYPAATKADIALAILPEGYLRDQMTIAMSELQDRYNECVYDLVMEVGQLRELAGFNAPPITDETVEARVNELDDESAEDFLNGTKLVGGTD